MTSKPSIDLEKFDWVQLKAELDAPHGNSNETSKDKFKRKFMENPLVPVGK